MSNLKKEHKKDRTQTFTTRSKSAEKILIWSLVIFGIVGLFFVLDSMRFKKNENTDTSIYKGSIDDNRSHDTKKILVTKKTVKEEKIKGKQLHINGPREALVPVLFEVENFNQNAEYILDFGDGIHRELKQRNESHIYKKAGNYKLALYVTYKGERRKLAGRSLEIMEPITVATDATRIDF